MTRIAIGLENCMWYWKLFRCLDLCRLHHRHVDISIGRFNHATLTYLWGEPQACWTIHAHALCLYRLRMLAHKLQMHKPKQQIIGLAAAYLHFATNHWGQSPIEARTVDWCATPTNKQALCMWAWSPFETCMQINNSPCETWSSIWNLHTTWHVIECNNHAHAWRFNHASISWRACGRDIL